MKPVGGSGYFPSGWGATCGVEVQTTKGRSETWYHNVFTVQALNKHSIKFKAWAV